MQTVEFRDVEVLEETVDGLLCRIGQKEVVIPSPLLQPGTAVRRPGDRGTLVIPRWLGIGTGLLWPFPAAAAPKAPNDAHPGGPPGAIEVPPLAAGP
jgi:hypothetical protein